jgi:type I restriction enzyme R subunit
MTKLIVLDKMVESMTTFKQIIGRGTRIRKKEGKTEFMVMDFRNVTRHFADPDWDGPIEQHEDFQYVSSEMQKTRDGNGDEANMLLDPEKPYTPTVAADGCTVETINKTISRYDAKGKLLRQEDIIDYTRTNIIGEYASLSDFIRKWKSSEKKEVIEQSLAQAGIDLHALKVEQGMEEVDDFDFICYVAYGKKPLTRQERANNVKKRDFFSKYSGDARAVLEILLDKYMNQGITEVEDIKVLSLADFANYGKPAKIIKLFGGKEQYKDAVRKLEENIYDEVG